ncbi:hypothetical protein WG66_015887 [Moniliophthora roreri]|nr:hypothetical protein WG66_015887 [Moniliophthora roreri]
MKTFFKHFWAITVGILNHTKISRVPNIVYLFVPVNDYRSSVPLKLIEGIKD